MADPPQASALPAYGHIPSMWTNAGMERRCFLRDLEFMTRLSLQVRPPLRDSVLLKGSLGPL